jgi:hypothetical protein
MNNYGLANPIYLNDQYVPQRTPTRHWFTVVELEGCFPPTQVTAKVNPQKHILVVKAKPHTGNVQPSVKNVAALGKMVRVIPLPQTIHLHQLKVQMTPDCRQIIAKAPFVLPGEDVQEQHQPRYLSSTWIPIPIAIKAVKLSTLPSPYPHEWYTDTNTNININVNQKQRIQESPASYGCYTPSSATSFVPYPTTTMNANQKSCKCCPTVKCLQHVMGNQGEGVYYPKNRGTLTLREAFLPALFGPQYIRDPISGTLATIVKVNTIGYPPQDIIVRVNEVKRILIVETGLKRPLRGAEMSQQQPLPLKYFRREFVLPRWIDLTHIGYYVSSNGLLNIKLPIVKGKEYKFEELVSELEGELKNVLWKRIPVTTMSTR